MELSHTNATFPGLHDCIGFADTTMDHGTPLLISLRNSCGCTDGIHCIKLCDDFDLVHMSNHHVPVILKTLPSFEAELDS